MRAMRRSLVLVLAALGCSSPPTPVAPRPVVAATPAPIAVPPTARAPEVPTLRLPRSFLPTSYSARLDLDPAKDGFEGSIAITGVLDQTSSVLWLHGRGLAIHRASATSPSERVEIALTVTQHGEDLLELRAAAPLGAGEWTLLVDYSGKLDLVNTTGAFKQVVAGDAYVFSQLEALYARRVFPCFDEPDNKVPWKLTLDVPQKLVAVSNTPIASEAPLSGDRKRVEFAPTKPLPSYLIAFGVGPFEIVDGGKTKSGTPVRIVTLAHRAADAAYAAKTTGKLLELTEEFFGVPYPYDKLDILSIPITVGFGAMENAGLITFAETLVLLDKPSRGREHKWIAVAAHEIAHQWFGDLVTMGYWDDIWLNEGFATWLAHKTSATFDPSWHDEQSELGVRDAALEADGLVSARQIRQPIHVQDDILNAFDGITYGKGASVLNMFEAYLGPEVFQRGVRDYLKARAWGNATSADFIGALGTAAGKDVSAAFATLLDQPGAPEITATLTCTGSASVNLAQHRYLPPGARTPAATTPWIVPVCVAFERGGKRAEICTQLDQPTATIALDVPRGACPRWMMPNVDGRGYYRNTYTVAQAATLRDEAWPQLRWSERRALYFDVEDGVMTGRLPLMLALSFVPRLLAGSDRFTVADALELPASLEDLVADDLRAKYTAWIRETFGPGARQAGFAAKSTDDLDVESTRSALLGAVAGTGRDPELVATAVALADTWRELPQAVRGLVLAIAVDARPEVFERIRKDVVTERDRARRKEMFSALGAVRDVKQQTLALGLVLDGRVDMRESLTMLGQGSTDALRANAQQFFRDHADEILRRMPHDETRGPGLSGVFTATCKAERRDEIVAYVTRTFGTLPGGPHKVKESIEAMDQCIARRKILEPEIRGWLTGVKIAKPAAPKPEPKAVKPGKKKDRRSIEGAEKAPAPRRRRK